MSELKDSMKKSAGDRVAMLKKFGFIPNSLLKLARGELSRSMFIYQREERTRSVSVSTTDAGSRNVSDKAKAKAAERQEAGVLGGVLTAMNGTSRTGASIMPAELVEFFIKYYAKPGDVYVDPFMGQGIQMQVAKRMGLHYYGYDLSKTFFKYIQSVKEKIDDGKTKIVITRGDSRHPTKVPDGVGDFSFHSPPYWDIEYYGDEPEQLGKQSYQEFLKGMEEVARAWLPKHKPGSFHVVNVNDFRRDGEFYAYHADTIALYQRAGWKLHDMWIVEGLISGLSRVFAVSKNAQRIVPKVHEYCIVFRRS